MIRLRTLGALDVRDAEGQECRSLLAQPKRVALVVYLALASPRGPHRRDVLLSLFWPELDSEHARNALSQSMHFLRRTLGAQTLVNKGSELSLACEKLWCDAIAFEEAIASGHASEALELYRGDLLEGFHVGNAPEFERWLETERTRLADVYLRAARAVAEKRDLADDHEAAVALWKRLATRDPYSSQVAIGYMRALAASADRTGALQHARVYESLLREELNAEPDRGVMALAHQLQSATPAAEKPARQAAPPPLLQASAEKLVLPPAPSAMPASVVAEPRNGTSSIAVAEKKSRYPRYFSSIAATLVLLLIAVGGAVAFRVGPHADARAEIRSLAVLPFEDLTGDSSQRSFAEGMHEALIAELARYPELRVISRTSVLRYRSTTKSLPEIARELRVDGVVEGAVLRDGGRIRMNAQLVHAPSDHEVWAEHYVRDLRDILVLQSELAAAIAGEVHVAIHPVPRPSIDRSGAADAPPRELYLRELYLRGRHAEISRSLNGLETAREAYRRAIAEDSAFALGWAGLAAVYGFMADYGYAPMQPMLDSARMLALRAVALDSTLPETRAAFAVTLGDAHNFAGAEREFRRAIELGPSNARAHYWYSVLLVALGRGDEALREAERALELDPFSPRGGTAMKRYATFLLTGQYPHLKLPVNERRPILKLEPGEPWARAREATDWAQAGRCQEARSEIARARQGAPGENFRMLPSVATVHWWCGHRDSTRAILARMKKLPRAGENGYRVALVHILLGEKDSVFVWLERQRWTMAELSGLSADSQLEPIRRDPRYAALLQRLGIRARP